MSLCRGRLYFDASVESTKDKPLAKTLNFDDDSDMEDGEFDSSTEIRFSLFSTPPGENGKSRTCWDSGIGSPTPKAGGRPVPRQLCSPIPFDCCSDEVGSPLEQELERIPPVPPSPRPYKPALTPPHKKFRSLRIYDTPLTPKSLLQKAQRRVTSASRSSIKSLTPSTEKAVLDPSGPQANINPFSSERPTQGVKRCRNVLDNR